MHEHAGFPPSHSANGYNSPAPNGIAANAFQPNAKAAPDFERNAEDSFRIAATGGLEKISGFYEAGAEGYEHFAHALRSSAEEIAAGIGQFNSKLMEFGSANAQSNLTYAANAAGIRSLQDAFEMQAAYLREQYDTASAQFRELQALATEIAGKAASPFQQQFLHYTQMIRSC
jgi:hypothetical protein